MTDDAETDRELPAADDYPAMVGPGATVRHGGPRALADLRAALGQVALGKLKCSATSQRPSEITCRVIARAMADGDYYPHEAIASFAWPLLLLAGGLARLEGPWMRTTARGAAVLEDPQPEHLRGLWDRWLLKAPIDELMRVDAIRGQRKPGVLSAPTKRRAAAAAGLGRLPVGEWVAVDRLFDLARKLEPPLAVPRTAKAVWDLYVEDAERGSLGYAREDLGEPGAWDVLEGRYLLCLAFEYAATLGLVDVAYRGPQDAREDFRGLWGTGDYRYLSRYDGLLAVRRNDFAAALG
ncbi:hypothetical protein KDL01_28205 [Actinospica durhamensis]|uniref:Uncharacterized protein n=1 Tax=Actinospica durhamensis TaxID=1508375 RepID=A0A941IUA9_9ACTN|nr:hypothetical protein [Actinospica durhamensis]MBR7837193.1 hypothetical protein [Actinospica durhamensis]